MTTEAQLITTEAGLLPATPGWFVLNARETRWFDKGGLGHSLPLTGVDESEAETLFPMLGMSIRVIEPRQPSTVYHWETEQEGFLVLSGEAIAILDGQERPLNQWDFIHCPPGVRHAFVGAGEGPCVLLCAGSRQFQKDGPWGEYCADPAADRHNAASPQDTTDGDLAYARFGPARATPYREGLLPGD